MNRTKAILATSFLITLLFAATGYAWGGPHGHYGGGHWRGGHYGGGYWRGGIWIDPFLLAPLAVGPYSYPYPYGYEAPPVIVQQPSVDYYVQPAPQQQAEPSYWYYCRKPAGYYPYVQQCPSGWLKVVPTPPTQNQGN